MKLQIRTADVLNAVSTGFCTRLSTTTAQSAMIAAARQAAKNARMVRLPSISHEVWSAAPDIKGSIVASVDV
jgi:hypothetical protein